METAHRAYDEVPRIESELFSEVKEVRRYPHSSKVDGVVHAGDPVEPETLDEKFSQGEGNCYESINSPAIDDVVQHPIDVHLERLEARERLGRAMDGSHAIRHTVTDRRQSSQNVVLVLVGVDDVDLVSAKIIAQLP